MDNKRSAENTCKFFIRNPNVTPEALKIYKQILNILLNNNVLPGKRKEMIFGVVERMYKSKELN